MTSTILRTENANVKVTLLSIEELKPHEKGSPLYLELLRKEIVKDGVMRYPIIADEKTHVILDGMHRWLALKSLGYTLIPVIEVDAVQKLKIRVGRRRIHRYLGDSDESIAIERVITAGLTGDLMEPRSTRHFFPFSKLEKINYPLSLLRKGVHRDVSKYLSSMTSLDCRMAIEDWLEEISEELDFLTKRKQEVEREKEDLLNRIKNINNDPFLP